MNVLSDGSAAVVIRSPTEVAVPLWIGVLGCLVLSTTPTTRAVMARKPRWQGTAFSWRWVSLWVYYNFVIKISRKKHTQPPSSLPSGREESLSGEKNLSETEQGQWEKYEWEREKEEEEKEGEQIKSCQMEILGFKRSETGVKGLPLWVVFVFC